MLIVSRYPSHPAWSRRGPLTRLAWARCSRGIRHAWLGLVAIISHAFTWAHCSYRGGGRSTGSRVERGRSVERDNRLRGEESPD